MKRILIVSLFAGGLVAAAGFFNRLWAPTAVERGGGIDGMVTIMENLSPEQQENLFGIFTITAGVLQELERRGFSVREILDVVEAEVSRSLAATAMERDSKSQERLRRFQEEEDYRQQGGRSPTRR